MSWAMLILCLLGVPLVLWSLLWLMELLLAVTSGGERSQAGPVGAGGKSASYVVLIPAHNEAEVIEGTLHVLMRQICANGRVLLVADNCSDDTAELGRNCGAEVIERRDRARRGKGHALSFGLRHLESQPPQVVVVLDADCRFTPGSLQRLVDHAIHHHHPAQSDYRMRLKGGETLPQRVAHFAWRVKNSARPRGLRRIGMPCQLTGTGMAFPWETLEPSDIPVDSIVEDMELGLRLACKGREPRYLGESCVVSEFPNSEAAERDQRNRWEHGHLSVIGNRLLPLLLQSLGRRNWKLAILCLDLSIPPVTFLVLLTLSYCAVALLSFWVTGAVALLYPAAVSLGVIMLTVGIGWYHFGRDLLRLSEVMGLPIYIARKIRIYTAFFTGRRGEWIRTERK